MRPAVASLSVPQIFGTVGADGDRERELERAAGEPVGPRAVQQPQRGSAQRDRRWRETSGADSRERGETSQCESIPVIGVLSV